MKIRQPNLNQLFTGFMHALKTYEAIRREQAEIRAEIARTRHRLTLMRELLASEGVSVSLPADVQGFR